MLKTPRDYGWNLISRTIGPLLKIVGSKRFCWILVFKIVRGNIGFNWLITRESIYKFGSHTRISVKNKFASFFGREYVHVSKLSIVNRQIFV